MSGGRSAVDLRGLLGVAAYGLRGATVELPVGPLPARAWRSLLSLVLRNRVVGHLHAAVAAGDLKVSPPQRAEAEQAHVDAMAAVLALERCLLDTVQVLEAHGIDYRILRGPALAHLAYPDPSLRSFGDVDLLVPPEQVDAAVAALSKSGYRRLQPRPWEPEGRRQGRAVTLRMPDRWEVDLHRTIAPGPLGRSTDVRSLFETATRFPLAGRELPTLGRDELLLHSCYTAALSGASPSLVTLRDIVQLVLEPGVDLERVGELAARWDGLAVLAHGIASAWRTFALADVVPLSAWAQRYVHSPRERRLLALYARAPRQGLPGGASARARSGLSAALATVGIHMPERVLAPGGAQQWRGGRVQLSRAARR